MGDKKKESLSTHLYSLQLTLMSDLSRGPLRRKTMSISMTGRVWYEDRHTHTHSLTQMYTQMTHTHTYQLQNPSHWELAGMNRNVGPWIISIQFKSVKWVRDRDFESSRDDEVEMRNCGNVSQNISGTGGSLFPGDGVSNSTSRTPALRKHPTHTHTHTPLTSFYKTCAAYCVRT